MDVSLREAFKSILEEELVPAMGCTEPSAIAYAGAVMKKTLGAIPERVDVVVSGNIVKNVKSVVVPHTGGMRGIKAAAAAGIVAGDPEIRLEVLSHINESQINEIEQYIKNTEINVSRSESDRLFEIIITGCNGAHSAKVTLLDGHTNVAEIVRDGEVLFSSFTDCGDEHKTDRSSLTVRNIVDYAVSVDVNDVKSILERQIRYNTDIARVGLSGEYGAGIGYVLLRSNGNSVSNRAKAWAAAGSDARMNGCELPVIINSGSGNQGMTASLPVIVYADELGSSREELYRALIVSNLVTIHLKSGIGCLSAYCGAISAGCGAGAGITYLYGGRYTEISHTIVNALAINSGVVCDGAKASCAAKIASAVEAGLLGMHMYMNGREFFSGDGIITKGIEETIENVAELARNGMRETDREILRIMLRGE